MKLNFVDFSGLFVRPINFSKIGACSHLYWTFVQVCVAYEEPRRCLDAGLLAQKYGGTSIL